MEKGGEERRAASHACPAFHIGYANIRTVRNLKNAVVGLRESTNQSIGFRAFGNPRRHGQPIIPEVVMRVRRCKTDSTCIQGVFYHGVHCRNFVFGRSAKRSLFTHDISARHRVSGKNRHIRYDALGFQHFEVFREGLVIPAHTGTKSINRHAFDDRKITRQEVAVLGFAGCDAEAAIPRHDCRDAERGGGSRQRIPCYLSIVVRMDINKARSQNQAISNQCFLCSLALEVADGNNSCILYRNINSSER